MLARQESRFGQGVGLMDYLLVKLVWYVVAAFAIGVFVGWVSCGEVEE